MKNWLVQHKGQWHKVKEIQDTGIPAHEVGGGNVYHVEGLDKPIHQSEITDMKMDGEIEKADKIPGGLADKKKPSDFDAKKLTAGIKVEMEHTSDKGIATEIAMDHLTEDENYYDKLKEIEKQDRAEVTADGKITLEPGKESLKKDPKARWEKIKKALNHETAFLNIAEELNPKKKEELEDDEQADDGQDQMPEASEDTEQNMAEPTEESSEDMDATMPESEAQEGDAEAVSAEEDAESENPSEAETQDQPVDEAESEEIDPADAEAKIIQALKDDGYSEHEIAYIVHGHHAPEISQTDSAKADSIKNMSEIEAEHARRQKDVEHQHSQRLLDLEYDAASSKKKQADHDLEHKKRLADLEYEQLKSKNNEKDPIAEMKAKQVELELEMKRKEKELELEFKRKELELKLRAQELALKQKQIDKESAVKEPKKEETND